MYAGLTLKELEDFLKYYRKLKKENPLAETSYDPQQIGNHKYWEECIKALHQSIGCLTKKVERTTDATDKFIASLPL